MRFDRILRAKNIQTRIAKSLILGCTLALLFGWLTSETKYIKSTNDINKRLEISAQQFDDYSYQLQKRFIKTTKYNELIIIISLLLGTAIGYVIIKQDSNNSIDLTKWN